MFVLSFFQKMYVYFSKNVFSCEFNACIASISLLWDHDIILVHYKHVHSKYMGIGNILLYYTILYYFSVLNVQYTTLLWFMCMEQLVLWEVLNYDILVDVLFSLVC